MKSCGGFRLVSHQMTACHIQFLQEDNLIALCNGFCSVPRTA